MSQSVSSANLPSAAVRRTWGVASRVLMSDPVLHVEPYAIGIALWWAVCLFLNGEAVFVVPGAGGLRAIAAPGLWAVFAIVAAGVASYGLALRGSGDRGRHWRARGMFMLSAFHLTIGLAIAAHSILYPAVGVMVGMGVVCMLAYWRLSLMVGH